MVVRSLDVKNDPFRPCEKGEELLGPEVPYLSAISALMYLVNCTRLDIAFSSQFISQVQFRSNPKTLEWYQAYIALPPRNNLYGYILLKGIKATIVWI